MHIHLCISLIDSESSCCGNDVRLRSLHSSCLDFAADAVTTPGAVQVKTRLMGYKAVVCFLVERRGLPAFLPFITWERIMRRSAEPMPVSGLPPWSMNCSAMEACRIAFTGLRGLLDKSKKGFEVMRGQRGRKAKARLA